MLQCHRYEHGLSLYSTLENTVVLLTFMLIVLTWISNKQECIVSLWKSNNSFWLSTEHNFLFLYSIRCKNLKGVTQHLTLKESHVNYKITFWSPSQWHFRTTTQSKIPGGKDITRERWEQGWSHLWQNIGGRWGLHSSG